LAGIADVKLDNKIDYNLDLPQLSTTSSVIYSTILALQALNPPQTMDDTLSLITVAAQTTNVLMLELAESPKKK
jgi:hypothetical protein